MNVNNNRLFMCLLQPLGSKSIFFVCFVLLYWVQIPSSKAQTLGPGQVLVLDFQSVLNQSNAYLTVQEQANAIRTTFRDEFASVERDLRVLERQLSDLRDELAPEEFNLRRRSFEVQVVDAQRAAQERRATLDQVVNEATDEIRQALLRAVAGIAEDLSASLVLEKENVILVSTELDISSRALEALNAELPSVTLRLPEIMPLSPVILDDFSAPE